MAIVKYIIDKSDLTELLRGEVLAIQQKGNIRGFCVEIAGNFTNGDVIKAMFNIEIVDDFTSSYGVKLTDSNYVQFNKDWWNAPYNAEREVEE